MSGGIGEVQSESTVSESSGVTGTGLGGESIGVTDVTIGQLEKQTPEVSLPSRKAIKDQSPDEQVTTMIAIAGKVKSGKYVSELGFWKNFCAWIQSIFTDQTRDEILLDMFWDEIGNKKSEFCSALKKQLEKQSSDDENLRHAAEIMFCQGYNSVVENIMDKDEDTIPEKSLREKLENAKTLGLITEEKFENITERLALKVEKKILLSSSKNEIDKILQEFKGENNSFKAFSRALKSLLTAEETQNDLTFLLIPKEILTIYEDLFVETLCECEERRKETNEPIKANNFAEKFKEKIKKKKELFNFFTQKNFLAQKKDAFTTRYLSCLLFSCFSEILHKQENIQSKFSGKEDNGSTVFALGFNFGNLLLKKDVDEEMEASL